MEFKRGYIEDACRKFCDKALRGDLNLPLRGIQHTDTKKATMFETTTEKVLPSRIALT